VQASEARIGGGWLPDEVESAPCDLCGGEDVKPVIVRPDGMQVVECASCGYAWLDPRPRQEFVARLYDRGYFAGDRFETGIGYPVGWESSPEVALAREHAEARLRIINEHRVVVGARLVDIGCANGDFCQVAAGRGASVLGVDLSEDAIAVATRLHPGLSFQAGTAEELVGSGKRFDIVCAFEVIEHVTSPTAFLASLAELCDDGGVIVLSTPNYAEARRVGPERWLGFHASFEHLNFMTVETIGIAAAKSSLEVVDWFATGSGLWSPPPTSGRSGLRALLSRIGLLGTARSLRRLITGADRVEYAQRGVGHTALVLLRGGHGGLPGELGLHADRA